MGAGAGEGVAVVAREGLAPGRSGRTRRTDVPVALPVVQGVAETVRALLFVVVPGVSASYRIPSAVTAQVLVARCALGFAGVIRRRHTRPDVPRPHRIPGRLPGVWLVG
ncbi:hypothetical protein [Geodermatophilus sp. URMC 63]